MAHEIENEMIAYSGAMPWHGIGAELPEGASPSEFLKAAKLDWNVEKHPIEAVIGDTRIAVPDKFALVRSTDQKVMSICGKEWKPFQNTDCLDFMKRYCDAGGATMETAGGLRDGQIVWALARLNHSFEVRPGDKVNGYVLLTSPHFVGKVIDIRTTTVRVVCANTMAMANRSSSVEYKQSHRHEFDVASAKMAIENAHECLANAEKRAKIIDQLKIGLDDTVKKVLVPVFEPELLDDEKFMSERVRPNDMSSTFQGIINSMMSAPGHVEGTGWGVLNGVTHWADHVAGRNEATRLYRSWMGDNAKAKIEIEAKLFELAD